MDPPTLSKRIRPTIPSIPSLHDIVPRPLSPSPISLSFLPLLSPSPFSLPFLPAAPIAYAALSSLR